MRRLLGRGVPSPLRGRVWFALLRAALDGRPDRGGNPNPNLNPNPNPNPDPNPDPNPSPNPNPDPNQDLSRLMLTSQSPLIASLFPGDAPASGTRRAT